MLSTRYAQARHWRVPKLGTIVTVQMRPLQHGHRYQKYQVVAYPLRDKSGSSLAHCCILQALDNTRDMPTVAAHWLVES